LPLKIKQGSPFSVMNCQLGSNKYGKKIREERRLREKQEKLKESFETCKIERLGTLN
jgi:hypothetical protein